MHTCPTEIAPPCIAASDTPRAQATPAGPAEPANPPDLRARPEHDFDAAPKKSPPVPLTAAVSAPPASPAPPTPAASAPPSPTDRPTLPADVDPDLLLFHYFESQSHHELAINHGLDPDTLFDWAEHPHTKRLLERLRAFSDEREKNIRSSNACTAAVTLYHLVRAPLFMDSHISIAAKLRSQEIALKAAITILAPIEREKTARRTFNLRRALAALKNPRKRAAPSGPQPNRVAQASRLCASSNRSTALVSGPAVPPARPRIPGFQPAATPSGAGLQPGTAPGGAGLQPVGGASPKPASPIAQVAQAPQVAPAPRQCASPSRSTPAPTAPGGAGLQPAGSASPRPATSEPSPKHIQPTPSSPTPAQNLRHRAGALPRAP